MTTEVPLYSFQGSLSSSGSWTTYEPDTTRKTARLSTTLSSLVRKTLNKSDKRTLRLLTFNIWFDAFFKAERALAVIRIIEELEPDVCCFQEVTPQFEEALRTSKHFQRYWALTGLDDQLQLTGFGYGTLIAVKRDLFDTTGVFKDPKTGVIISGTTPKEPPNIRRLDLVISKGPGLTAQVAQLVGETAIPKKDLKGAEGVDLNGVTVYPSDHKGVMVDFEMVTPP
ncbi:hypothetical protein FRB99_001638 [Tulasnella sp. 403]|nr:hypothetical protein FRB99_001638 [Tulasnella sp. 403]